MVVDLLHFNELNSSVTLDFVDRSPAAIEPDRALTTSISLQRFVVVPGSLPRFVKTIELDFVDLSPEILEHRCGHGSRVFLGAGRELDTVDYKKSVHLWGVRVQGCADRTAS